jgi:cytidine deaminase
MAQQPDDVIDQLLNRSAEVRKQAYCIYSGYAVGAAVLTPDGRMYSGCNVENVSFGLTICAERNALASAVAHSPESPVFLVAIALVAGPVEGDSAMAQVEPLPCGACLQVIAEFARPDSIVICAPAAGDGYGEPTICDLRDLLPYRFGDNYIQEEPEEDDA